ncbi:MAG: hypothetical protein GF320_05640 [Armatimonadia bacterium]|nr:hypothetical protein [Armatimonadia bacterium]
MKRHAMYLPVAALGALLLLLTAPGEARADWYDISVRIGGSSAGGHFSLGLGASSYDRCAPDLRGPTVYVPSRPRSYTPYTTYECYPDDRSYRVIGLGGPGIIVYERPGRGRGYGPPHIRPGHLRNGHFTRYSGPSYSYRYTRSPSSDHWQPYDLRGRGYRYDDRYDYDSRYDGRYDDRGRYDYDDRVDRYDYEDRYPARGRGADRIPRGDGWRPYDLPGRR